MKNNIYVIAELGNTHDGSLGNAKQLIRTAAECHVDAVKIQTHIFEAESLLNAPNPPYFKGEPRKQYFERTSFDKEQYFELIEVAENECSVDFLSSPFSIEAVDFLENLDMKMYKIPSGEVTNIPLLKHIAMTEKPVILSSGMSAWDEIDLAVKTLESHGCTDLTLLQCSSIYPCPPDKVGLNIMLEMKERYDVEIGYSDHTLGMAIPLAAVTMGAKVIEKHFTLSRKMYGSDAKNSMEPKEFSEMVSGIREIEQMKNNPLDKDHVVRELGEMKNIFEKSVVSTEDIQAGVVIRADMLAVKKPGTGIPAKHLDEIVGKTTAENIKAGTIINHSQIKDFKYK